MLKTLKILLCAGSIFACSSCISTSASSDPAYQIIGNKFLNGPTEFKGYVRRRGPELQIVYHGDYESSDQNVRCISGSVNSQLSEKMGINENFKAYYIAAIFVAYEDYLIQDPIAATSFPIKYFCNSNYVIFITDMKIYS